MAPTSTPQTPFGRVLTAMVTPFTPDGALDLDGADELITYCTIGGRACTAWFVLTYLLGRESVRVYDGSWAEWGRMADALVEQA